ncbi:DUF6642 family protein [Desulfitobacterium sp. Sab5]|uniref:DUF6642 family protein n=1 Tax=Desulfitobacterium nosdiversum TaxID=3375356 RepID=UPI003CEA9695
MKLVFCVESDWEGSARKQSSILPMLECINGVYPDLKYIFRTANTKEELKYCLGKFKQVNSADKDFCVFIFSGHGTPGKIRFGKKGISLSELGLIVQEVDDELFKKHVVHFDSCSVSKNSAEVQDFLRQTRADLVTGFSSEVDFIESLAFEMIYLDYLRDDKPKNVEKRLQRLQKDHKGFCDRLKFEIASQRD